MTIAVHAKKIITIVLLALIQINNLKIKGFAIVKRLFSKKTKYVFHA